MRKFLSVICSCLIAATIVVTCGAVWLGVFPFPASGPQDIPIVSQLLELLGAGEADEGHSKVSLDPPEVPESEHGLWYEQLNEDERRVYDWLLAYLPAREETFTIMEATEEEAGPAFRAVMGDHPELFWLTGAYTYRQPQDGSFIEITPAFVMPADEVAALESQVESVVSEIMALIPAEASEYDRARICYEWIIDNTTYDEAAHDQSIQGVFLDRVAVCAGYARAFQHLMHEMGVRCDYLSGGGHAWNLVWIDGTPTYVDTTWGDPVFMAENGERAPQTMVYDYLCLTADELYRNHTVGGPVSDPQVLPACDSTTYDYYRMNGLFFDEFSADGLAALIEEAAWHGETSVRVKYGSAEGYQQALDYLQQEVFAIPALAEVNSIYRGGDEVLRIVSVDW